MQFISPDSIKPRGRMVLIRANTEEGRSAAGLHLLDSARYPNLGWIVAVGDKADPSLSPNQYVLLESEGDQMPGVPVDFFQITVESSEGLVDIALPIEEEPPLREAVKRARGNREKDRRIQLADILTDETWTLMLSDIKDFSLGSLPQSDTRLEYTHAYMFHLPEGLYYLVEDRTVEAIIEY